MIFPSKRIGREKVVNPDPPAADKGQKGKLKTTNVHRVNLMHSSTLFFKHKPWDWAVASSQLSSTREPSRVLYDVHVHVFIMSTSGLQSFHVGALNIINTVSMFLLWLVFLTHNLPPASTVTQSLPLPCDPLTLICNSLPATFVPHSNLLSL